MSKKIGKVNRAELIKEMRRICKVEGVRLNIQKRVNKQDMRVYGEYRQNTGTIRLYSSMCKSNVDLLSTFIHELSHAYACKQGWWFVYHHYSLLDSEACLYVEHCIELIAKNMWDYYVEKEVWGKYYIYYKLSAKKTLKEFFKKYYNTNK